MKNRTRICVARFFSFLSLRVLIPLIRWIGRDLPAVQNARAGMAEAQATGGANFVAPLDDHINPLVLMAAFQDYVSLHTDNPEVGQGTLNACMNALRGSDQICGAAVSMLGSLIAAGYHPNEAILRVQANALMLGILLERRIAFDGVKPETPIGGRS